MTKEVVEGNVSVDEQWDDNERKKEEYSFQKLRKNNVYKDILFSNSHFTKCNPNTGATISGFYEPAYPTCMDILKYVLAQATDCCAGFLVRVWWRYIRLRFLDTEKCRENYEWCKKSRRPFHYFLLSVLFNFTIPLIAALNLIRISRFVDLPQQACSIKCMDAL
jgi:hypothetical protein